MEMYLDNRKNNPERSQTAASGFLPEPSFPLVPICVEGARLPAVDAIQARIGQIQTASEFGDWLKSFMDRVEANPEVFSQTAESMNWLRDISRFAVRNHQGYFGNLNLPAPDSPQGWQLLAHVIYSTFPDGD